MWESEWRERVSARHLLSYLSLTSSFRVFFFFFFFFFYFFSGWWIINWNVQRLRYWYIVLFYHKEKKHTTHIPTHKKITRDLKSLFINRLVPSHFFFYCVTFTVHTQTEQTEQTKETTKNFKKGRRTIITKKNNIKEKNLSARRRHLGLVSECVGDGSAVLIVRRIKTEIVKQ